MVSAKVVISHQKVLLVTWLSSVLRTGNLVRRSGLVFEVIYLKNGLVGEVVLAFFQEKDIGTDVYCTSSTWVISGVSEKSCKALEEDKLVLLSEKQILFEATLSLLQAPLRVVIWSLRRRNADNAGS